MKTTIALLLAQLTFASVSFATSPPPPYSPAAFEFTCAVKIKSIVGGPVARYELIQSAVATVQPPKDSFHDRRIVLQDLEWKELPTEYAPTAPIDFSKFDAHLSFERAGKKTSVELFVKAAQPSDSGKAEVSSYNYAQGRFQVGTKTSVRTSNEVRTMGQMKHVEIEMSCLQTK